MTAAADWAEALQQWAIPAEILAAAPEPPWGFPVGLFVDSARRAMVEDWTPTHQRVAEALPGGGSLLDVGSGAGAASVPAAPPAGRIVAVDQDAGMLQALAEVARGRAPVQLIEGLWPDVADQVEGVDVAVCAHVAYNVADLGAFVRALTAAASRRVVLELSAFHPQSPLSPLWRHFWGLPRPGHPTAEDARAVIREVTGLVPEAQSWAGSRPFMGERGPEAVTWARRRLCLPPTSDDEVAAALDLVDEASASAMVTLWWPGAGGDALTA